MRSLKQRTVHALYWSIAGTAGKVLAQFFIQVWLVRTLGPTPYGEYASLLILISIGVLLAESGFGSSLVQRKSVEDADVEYAFGLIVVSSLTLAGLVYLNAQAVAELFGIHGQNAVARIGLCAAIIPVMALSNISLALLRRNLRNQAIAIIHLGSYLLGFGCVGILAAAAGWGSTALLTAYLAQAVVTLVAGYAMTRHSLRMRLSGDRSLLRFGVQVVSTNAINWLIENCDRYIIGRYWGTHDLGAYSVAANLARTPSGLLLGAIQPVAFSSASRVQDEVARLREGYQDLLHLTALVVFPLFAILHANAGSIILHLYGDAWVSAIPLFSVMCVAIPLHCLMAVTGPILWATNSIRRELQAQMVVAALMVGTFFLLRDEPIAQVVWAIPVLYLLRFLMVYRALSDRLGIGLAALLHSVRGGAVLALAASLSSHAISGWLLGATGPHPAMLDLLAPTAAVLVTLLVAGLLSRHVIHHRVRAALVARLARRAPAAT